MGRARIAGIRQTLDRTNVEAAPPQAPRRTRSGTRSASSGGAPARRRRHRNDRALGPRVARPERPPAGLARPGDAYRRLFLLVLALLRGNEDGWTSGRIVAELAGAAAFLAAFVAVQHRSKSPMLPLGLFRRPDFTGAQVAAFSISGSLFAIFLYATLYPQNVLG